MPTNTGIHQQETLSYTLVDSSADGWRIDPWNMVTKASILMVIIARNGRFSKPLCSATTGCSTSGQALLHEVDSDACNRNAQCTDLNS